MARMPTARLLNPHTFDSDRLDPESRRQLQALIAWFEERGKTRLLRDDLDWRRPDQVFEIEGSGRAAKDKPKFTVRGQKIFALDERARQLLKEAAEARSGGFYFGTRCDEARRGHGASMYPNDQSCRD